MKELDDLVNAKQALNKKIDSEAWAFVSSPGEPEKPRQVTIESFEFDGELVHVKFNKDYYTSSRATVPFEHVAETKEALQQKLFA